LYKDGNDMNAQINALDNSLLENSQPYHRSGIDKTSISRILKNILSTDFLAETPYNFSRTELLVAWYFVCGFTYSEIANFRGVQMDTVKTQVRSILGKSGCSNRTELIHLALVVNHSRIGFLDHYS